jgi:hypothetical protein
MPHNELADVERDQKAIDDLDHALMQAILLCGGRVEEFNGAPRPHLSHWGRML